MKGETMKPYERPQFRFYLSPEHGAAFHPGADVNIKPDLETCMRLLEEVSGKVFYTCECGAYRTPEFELMEDLPDAVMEDMAAHIRAEHGAK